ncbi:MBL fold metallo-hydrolase [Tsukamurella paurometabola]|uniref:Metallo-beta-lactamase superfamily n=1 Tax=Tsukamurella paurometabola TaxID=2061 RepID=A0A3P8L999_TSUPA|nr:MBL fold metallo-hydrolase [Tsukamurella paurometabola]UEA83544.1 MBL fold metallo-hydrolase [Tsukamurella paurometabola]VDR40671.1 Metallo-beta-lactamase superfamily [Tsukamurella paurometabola]
MLTTIRPDLLETPTFSPFPGLTTHAYLWTPSSGGTVLFYSPGDAADFDAIAAHGGIAHQYLSHQDEAGPLLSAIAERFGSVLHAPAGDLAAIAEHAVPGVVLADRAVDDNGVETIPTPGHTPGSTSFLVTGSDGARYLFTGDTLYRGADGRWNAGYIPGLSNGEQLLTSLQVLGDLEPDLVASSAFAGERGAHAVDPADWRHTVAETADRFATGVLAR